VANLSSLVRRNDVFKNNIPISNNVGPNDTADVNLLEGTADVYSSSERCLCFCWQAPSAGRVIIEAWGASGSVPAMCCCGIGIPGNAGGYVKKEQTVGAGSYITGRPGCSVTTSSICVGTRSCASQIIICDTATGSTCICAEGGIAGRALCDSQAGAMYTCFISAYGVCATAGAGAGCGIICNYTSVADVANGFGGDINEPGGFSCMEFNNCRGLCTSNISHVTVSPGIVSASTSTVPIRPSDRCATGGHSIGLVHGIGRLGQWSPYSQPVEFCWAGEGLCMCSPIAGCKMFLPTGIPAAGPSVCGGIQDRGLRGGPGLVKIRFISN